MMRNTSAPIDCATSVELFILILLVRAIIRADDRQRYDVGTTILPRLAPLGSGSCGNDDGWSSLAIGCSASTLTRQYPCHLQWVTPCRSGQYSLRRWAPRMPCYGAGTVMVLDCTVTAPDASPADPANNLPSTAAPLSTVMVTAARMFPSKMLYVPSVAELPTCQ